MTTNYKWQNKSLEPLLKTGTVLYDNWGGAKTLTAVNIREIRHIMSHKNPIEFFFFLRLKTDEYGWAVTIDKFGNVRNSLKFQQVWLISVPLLKHAIADLWFSPASLTDRVAIAALPDPLRWPHLLKAHLSKIRTFTEMRNFQKILQKWFHPGKEL